MTTLLERAKKVRIGRSKTKVFTAEEIELAIAWLRGEVTLMQVARALKINANNDAYIPLARAIRQALEEGIISIKK